jgi:chaperonin cofactor prefoldin
MTNLQNFQSDFIEIAEEYDNDFYQQDEALQAMWESIRNNEITLAELEKLLEDTQSSYPYSEFLPLLLEEWHDSEDDELSIQTETILDMIDQLDINQRTLLIQRLM